MYLYEIRRKEKEYWVQWQNLSALPFPWEHNMGIAYIILSLLLLAWRRSREWALLIAFHSDNIQRHPLLPFASSMACTVQQVNLITLPCLSWSCSLFGSGGSVEPVLPCSRVCWQLQWPCGWESLVPSAPRIGGAVPGVLPLTPASFQALHPQKEWNNSLFSQLLQIWSDIEVLCRIEMEVLNKRGLFAAHYISFQPAARWNSIFVFAVYFLKWT